MPKRKFDSDGDCDNLSVPLPIQTFFWRQTSPFLRPKTGKVQEASCMEQREACKVFEKVLVQNIQFGLSPSLTEAIKSISRWRLIQASLPYVMHCCAALLYNRKDCCTEKLGAAETKLLYTLHWILLDAAEECMDAEIDRGILRPPGHYLFSITTMQVFVYLFAPLMECLNHSDFLTSFRLENGLKLWEPFWEYRHPDVSCFTSHVRPRRTFLKANRNKNAHTKFGDVFLGAEDRNSMEIIKNMVCQVTIASPEKLDSGPAVLPEEKLSSEESSQNVCEMCQTESSGQNSSEQSTCKCGKLSTSESTPGTSTTKKDGASKKTFPSKPTLSDVSMATYLDVAILRCLFISQWLEEGVYWALQFLYNRLRDIAEEQSQDWIPRKRSSSLPIPTIEISFYQSPEQKRRELGDTFLDGDKMCGGDSPFPPPSHHSSMQELRHSSLSGPSDKPKQKRMKIGDFRAFVEEKLRLSERLLDKLTKDDSRSSSISEDQDVALLVDAENITCESKDVLPLVKNPRPQSALAMIGDKPSKLEDSASVFKSEMIRGKSLPSLHLVLEKPTAEIMSKLGKLAPPFTGKKVAHHTHSVPNPIITVTEHSPVASVQFFLNQDSAESPQEESPPVSALLPPCHQFYITRSQTDSNITYTPEDLQEAPGSAHYITKDGEICYVVVLKAIHAVTLRENACSLRVCEVILNLLELLLSLGLLPKKEPKEKSEQEHKIASEKPTESSGATGSGATEEPSNKQSYVEKSKSNSDKKNEELTVHNLFMNAVLRVIKHLGCPHGCGEGHRSPVADVLRTQTLNILTRLDQADSSQFRKFLRNVMDQHALTEVLDFFHSFVGFCSEQGTLLSPLNQKRSGAVLGQENGYANNFGGGLTSVYGKGPAGTVLGHVFKPLVTRLVQNMKDLKSQENMALYCDIRQLMTYIRDNHGGVFRRVALSGLLDSADRPHKKDQSSTPSTRIVRHSKSVDHDDYSREIISSPTVFVVNETVPEKSSRKSFFRRRGIRKAPSNQSVFDEREDHSVCASPALGQSTPSLLRHHRAVTPRLSVSEEGAHSLQTTPKSSRRRFPIVHWLKGERVKHARQRWSKSGSASPVLSKSYPGSERLSRRASCISRTAKLGQKSSSQMSLTLSRARKRMEDHLNKIGIGRNKNKYGSFEEPLDLSRRNSFDLEHGTRDGDLLVVKESKLVNIQLVRDGMFRFAFLMETCHPGSIPDPPLMAAALDLKAPVVARAALYLECAHFIHRCNKGQWPTWMKLNLPMFRPSGPLGNRGTPSGLRRTHILQRAAGRMFYQWAEAIGARLEEMLQREQGDSTENLLTVVDENKKRQYRIEDDEEDFLDEACVNPMGNNCPYALKMAACQLLLEITAFLRETYQYLPHKSSRLSAREKQCFEPRSVTANRRWSMALSSLGFSQNSAHSLVSLAEQGHPFALNERRISFVLHEADAEIESENSSNTTLTVQEDPNCGDDKKARRIAQGRTHLLRRTPGSAPCHNSSFKRRSLKLKKPVDRKNRPRSSTFAEDDDESYLKRTESIHSRRKVSAVSDRSDTSERADVSGEESPGVLSDEQAPESPNDVLESDDVSLTKNMPWLKVLVQISSSLNFNCTHQHFCYPNCYRRQMRACNRLVKAVRKVYGDEVGVVKDTEKQPEDKEDSKKEKKLKKIITAPSSPLRRKASVAHNLDKIEKAVDAPHLGALRSLHSSITCLAHDVETGGTADKGEQKLGPYMKKELKEELPIVKYLKNQAMTLFHSPLSTLVKGTVIMSDNCFKDILKVVWKLLLESDQQLAATAAALFTISSVKTPDQASELLEKELKHEDTAQRINAIHRFHALWMFRNQCWPRMEDGAQMYFKVPPPVVEFTLPSPKIAIDSVPIADPPWLPHVKTKVEEVTINQDQSLQRSFVTATKTRRKQQVELIHRALEAEEDKKQTARENFPITSVAVNLHAAYEPALYHAVDEHEEGEEDILTERNMQHHIQVAHPLFPSCLCSSAFHIISLLDDPQVNIDGVAVYEVAYKVIWLCLVEDTALFMRYFLEKLTREKQDVILQILRKLFHFIPRLPPQAAYTLYNYFIGYIMFYVRTPVEGGQELIANALSLVWLVVPSVQGLFFKDLKQILRKEQCDASLLITANVPSAKKIIIHGPDVGGIPSQFPVHEDTQFLHVLQDSFEFFGIEEAEQSSYFLVDTKTNQIHNLESFVRDFYFFKRSQYPQLSLVQMDPEQAFQRQQQQALTLKFLELGKVT